MYNSTTNTIGDKDKDREKSQKRLKNIYCVNCGEKGHIVRDCDAPVTSFGIIAFKAIETQEQEFGDTNLNIRYILDELNIKNEHLIIHSEKKRGFKSNGGTSGTRKSQS